MPSPAACRQEGSGGRGWSSSSSNRTRVHKSSERSGSRWPTLTFPLFTHFHLLSRCRLPLTFRSCINSSSSNRSLPASPVKCPRTTLSRCLLLSLSRSLPVVFPAMNPGSLRLFSLLSPTASRLLSFSPTHLACCFCFSREKRGKRERERDTRLRIYCQQLVTSNKRL